MLICSLLNKLFLNNASATITLYINTHFMIVNFNKFSQWSFNCSSLFN